MAIAKENKVVHGDDLTLIGQLIKAYFVAKETGKGLSTNDFTTALKTKLEGIDLAQYYTSAQTDAAIAAALNGSFVAVSTLPTASADTKGKIYLIPNSGTGTNTKDEYITVVSGNTYSWEKIGTTDIDLSGYVTDDALEALTSAEVTALLNL